MFSAVQEITLRVISMSTSFLLILKSAFCSRIRDSRSNKMLLLMEVKISPYDKINGLHFLCE